MIQTVRLYLAAAVFFLVVSLFLLPEWGSAAWLLSLQALPAAARWWWWGILLAASTAAAGRIYCSVLCPLGTVQELVWRTGGRPGPGYRLPGPLRKWVPGAAFAAAAAGFSSILLGLDPLGTVGRGVTQVIHPLARLAARIFSALMESHGTFDLAGIWREMSVLPEFFWTGLAILLALSVWSFHRGRPFCDSLCPVGAFLGLFSGDAPLSIRISGEKCSGCGRCEMSCPVGCLSASGHRVDSQRCVLCLRCLDQCPEGAIRLGRPPRREGAARRRVLRISLGTAAAVVYAAKDRIFPRRIWPQGTDPLPVSPPGSGSHGNFLEKCVACMACAAACPAGIIRPSLDAWGPAGILVPVLDYSRGYCQYECAACSSACPSGALAPLEIDVKKRTSVASAVFFRENCIVLKSGTACGACSEHCPTQAVHMVPYREGLTAPELDPSLCLGCGACRHVCPASPKAFTVEGKRVHTRIETGERGGEPVMAPLQEFPF